MRRDILSLVLLLGCLAGEGVALTCFIDAVLGNDSTGTGSSSLPWASFQRALVGLCDDIQVRPGVYSGPLNRNLQITTALNVTGTGGVNVVDDGPDEGAIMDLNGTARFFTAQSAAVRCSRLTFRNAVHNESGALMQSDSSIFFHQCSVHHNQISGPDVGSGLFRGGAVLADSIVAIHSSFRNNSIQRGSTGSITLEGAALFADRVQLQTCSFRFNRIITSGGGSSVAHGGAVAIMKQSVSGELLVMNNSLFYRNEIVGSGIGPKQGGALFFANPVDTPNRVPLQIRDSSFLSNRVIASGTRLGGALYSEEGNLDPLVDSLFFNNEALDNGGALYINQFSASRPSGVSGGNNSFVNNTATSGGDIFDLGSLGIQFSPASVLQCTAGVSPVISSVGCTGCTMQPAVDSDGDRVCNHGDCAPLDPSLQVEDTTGLCIALDSLNTLTGLEAVLLQGMFSLPSTHTRTALGMGEGGKKNKERLSWQKSDSIYDTIVSCRFVFVCVCMYFFF